MKTTIKKLLCLACAAVLVFGTVPLSAFATSEWTDSDYDIALGNLYEEFFTPHDGYRDTTCKTYMSNLDFNTGRFTDTTEADLNYDETVQYKRTSASSEHYKRLARLLACYIMYLDGDIKLTNFAEAENNTNPEIKTYVDVLNLLVDAYYEAVPPPFDESFSKIHNLSWWADTIGRSDYMMALLVMSEVKGGIFGEAQKAKLLEYLCDPDDMKDYPYWLTGANLTSYTRQGIVDGLITHDLNKIKKSLDRTKQEIYVSLDDPGKDGIQADFSHHQHGNQYYSNYGTTMIEDVFGCFAAFEGTALEDNSVYSIYEKRILDGFRWEKWGNLLPLHTAGRMISYEHTGPSSKEDSIVPTIKRMIEVYPEGRTEELQALKTYLDGAKTKGASGQYASGPAVIGNKYFWCSDYMVHNRSNYQVSELMVSERTDVSEQSNTSNFKGQNIGFGSVYLLKEGDVLFGCPVTWDWTKIPGTTMSDVLYTLPTGAQSWSQNSDFVGGVSDGNYGATAMVLSHRQTEAKKAMFFFDDEFVSLGSGITSAENNVTTTLDQRFRLGELYVNGELKTEKGTKEYQNVSSVLQNNIAYVFPEKADITIKDESVTGRYADIEAKYPGKDVEITNDMFGIWYDHGNQPRRQSYCYITIPEITKENLETYEKNIPVTIVSNTDDLQAVYHKGLNIGAAVFYKKGTVTLGNVTIAVSRPCIVMFTKTTSGYEVSASNPKATEAKLNVSLTVSGKTKNITFDLPGSPQGGPEMGGSTVTQSVAM